MSAPDSHIPDAQAPANTTPADEQNIALWNAIHSDYRRGLTYEKLSTIYSVPVAEIVKRRRAENWRRDLREDVKAEALSLLAASSASSDSGSGKNKSAATLSDEEIIQAGANVAAGVIRKHRDALSDHIAALAVVSAAQRRVVDALRRGVEPEAADLAFVPVDAKTGRVMTHRLAEPMLAVANAYARVIPLDRLAHGLNDKEQEESYEDRLRKFYAAQAEARKQKRTKRAADQATERQATGRLQ